MKHTPSLGQSASAMFDDLPADLVEDLNDPECADWYIAKRACEHGLDPHALISRRHARTLCVQAQAAQTWAQYPSGGTAEIVAPASATGSHMQWPPGRAGVIARYIFDTSYSPVKEVAITATLGLLAGVCGRGYRTYTGKDLALYIILVAKSGIGKDSTHEGIPMMLNLTNNPLASSFVRAQDFASGEALHKVLLDAPGFLALQGEFGRKLKRMSNPTDTPMQNFRTIMTNAYGKQFLEGKSYSNAEKDLIGVSFPALSFLGETTPSTFLECLTPDMMADGFLSRFLCVTYEGGRPQPNRNRGDAIFDKGDLNVWKELVANMVPHQTVVNVATPCIARPDADAQEKLERFEHDCIEDLNATDDESERQVWSRAHLKALKVASLLAVIDCPSNPVVRIEHVDWALSLVLMDVQVFKSRKESGDIGVNDDARELKLLAFIKEYLERGASPSYGISKAMQETGIVPRKYLQMRSASLPVFANHKLGGRRSLDNALIGLINNGHIVEVSKNKLADEYNFHGKAYYVVSLS